MEHTRSHTHTHKSIINSQKIPTISFFWLPCKLRRGEYVDFKQNRVTLELKLEQSNLLKVVTNQPRFFFQFSAHII